MCFRRALGLRHSKIQACSGAGHVGCQSRSGLFAILVVEWQGFYRVFGNPREFSGDERFVAGGAWDERVTSARGCGDAVGARLNG